MKLYEVDVSLNASNDLESIYLYISDKLSSQYAAVRIYNKILEVICDLEFMPARIPLMKSKSEKEKGYRLMPVDKYAVIFVINENDSRVEIHRILYGASNIISRLNNLED